MNSRIYPGVYIGNTETFRTTAELAGIAVITHYWRRIFVTVIAKKHNNIKSQKVAKHQICSSSVIRINQY